MAVLNKDMQEAIENYGSRITTLKDFVTACRTRVGMYLGGIGAHPGFINEIREIVQNAFDQLLDPTSPCDHIYFFYDERTYEVIVEDNGLGFPFKDMKRILTAQHTSKNFSKSKGDYSSGLNGVGSKIVCALSDVFIAESYKYTGEAVRLTFNKGYSTTEDPVKIPNKEKKQGAKIYFIPDTSVLGDDIYLQWKEIYTLIKHLLSLMPIGSKLTFEAIDLNGKKIHEDMVNKDGIITDLIQKVKKPIIKPIVISDDDGTHKIDCAFCYDAGDNINGPDEDVRITSFSNYCPTVAGTHIDGCIEGITRWFVQYMNNIYLINQKSKNKIKVASVDIKNGLNMMVSAAHIEPIFTGQAKEILSNADMTGFCKEVIMKGLDEWAKSNPQDLAKISKFFKEMTELRMKNEGAKAKIATKYDASPVGGGMPSKYNRPLGKKDIELIIVEGDSAKGTVLTGRDPQTQGVFPIRGKIINAFRNSKQVFFSNEEVQGITKIILGSEYKKGFSVEDCKVSKVIFMADADVDGSHISALLLRMFVMYFPQMIEAGMVYKAIPPLFSISSGKKNIYFTEQVDIVRYIQKIFMQNHKLTDIKDNPISNKDVTVFLIRNVDYIYWLEKVANTYAVNPYMLEQVLNHYVSNNGFKIDKLKKEIKSKYRFMDVKKENGIVTVSGVIDQSNLLIAHDKFFDDCSELIKIIKDNIALYYKLDSKVASIYEIMKLYNASSPSNVKRYKGLGEMNKEQLAESTLYPGSDRTLIRYTLQDAKEEIEAIREYESNPKKILGLVGNVSRDDLLE